MFRKRISAKAETIRTVPLFRSSSTAELERVARLCDVVDITPDTVIETAHEPTRQVVVILDGRVRAGVRTILGAGDVVGAVATLTETPASETVRAATPCRGLVFSRGSFSTLLDIPGVARALAKAIAAGRAGAATTRVADAPAAA